MTPSQPSAVKSRFDQTWWERLGGQSVDGSYQLISLIRLDLNGATFRALSTGAAEGPHNVFVTIDDAADSVAEDRYRRFLEAQFLQHPNILRVLGVGRCSIDGRNFPYLVTDPVDASLEDLSRERRLTVQEAKSLTRQVVGGLGYLHGENFVYCALRPASICRVQDSWKLADFSQLRVAGKYKPQDTRKLLITGNYYAPPEAYEGIVSPAWDVWSLGAMLQKILMRQGETDREPAGAEGTRTLGSDSLPSPFGAIVRDSLTPDLEERLNLDQIPALLSVPTPSPAEEESRAEARQLPAISEEPQPETPELAPAREVEERQQRAAPVFARMPFSSVPTTVVPVPWFKNVKTLLIAAAALGLLSVVVLSQQRHALAPDIQRALTPGGTQPESEIPPSGAQKPLAKSPAEFSRADSEREISALLDKWAESTRQRDVDGQADCYAPLVERLFGYRMLTRNQLKSQKERAFARIGSVQRFETSNLRFDTIGPALAVISFDKNWRFGRSRSFAGSARTQMVLRPFAGRWKITSEHDTKVYWVNKTEPPATPSTDTTAPPSGRF